MTRWKVPCLAVFGLISIVINTPVYAMPEKDAGNLGEIRQSILPVDAFQRIYGDGWILMNGANIEGTDLYKEGLWADKTIPDARGVYLRSMNHRRDRAIGNPRGDEELCGTYLADQLARHSHTIEVDGSVFVSREKLRCEHPGGLTPGPWFDNNGATGMQRVDVRNTGQLGDQETRPRSILVNTFIKVNRTPESQFVHVLTREMKSIPNHVVSHPKFREVLQRIIKSEVQLEMLSQASRAGKR